MIKVLIVDDDPAIRNTLRRLFRLSGFLPIAVEDGETAIELVAQEKPALVMLDYNLEGLNGIEVFERIQKVYPQVKAVMLTGQNNDEIREKALQKGFAGYLNKPSSLDEIIRLTNRLVAS